MFKRKTIYSYKNKYKNKTYSLKEKTIFTVIILILIQFLSCIPLYGINRDLLSSWLNSDLISSMGVFKMFSGLSFQNMSIFALGIAPYITASIVIQLLRVAIPSFDEICKDGATGKEKTEKYIYIGAVIIGILEIIPFVFNFVKNGLLIENNFVYISLVSVSLFIGSCILILLGKCIDKRGIGNGISLILLVNILSSIPTDFVNIHEMFISGKNIAQIIVTLSIIISIIVVTLLATIYLQEGKKDIKTCFSGKLSGNKNSKYSDSSIPLKVNMSGVMPIIFASSLLQIFPLCVALFGIKEGFFYKISKFFNQANWFDLQNIHYTLGVIIYILLVVFFTYFYNMISFNTTEISQNLSKRGGFIKGIRPGKPTQEYLDKQLKYLLLLGAFMLVGIALIPIVISGIFNISLSFGGTSVLIIVGVILETYDKFKTENLNKKVIQKSSILGGIS